MKRVIFSSLLSCNTNFSTVSDLYKVSRISNLQKAITGVLIYNDVFFIECVEGEDELIDALLEKISKDSRHKFFKILGEESIESRVFENWSIGFLNSDKKTYRIIFEEFGTTNLQVSSIAYFSTLNFLKRVVNGGILAI